MSRVLKPSCRLFGILALDAPAAVILRRGPTNWVEMIRWDTAGDVFERGQWVRARVYERRCDLSPDGKLLVYFLSKQVPRPGQSGYTHGWTAISKPPYFTALALWPKGDCWDGGGRFEWESRRRGRHRRRLVLHLNHCGEAPTHPDHPAPGSLSVRASRCGRGEDLPIYNDILLSKGWSRPEAGEHVWTKPGPDGRLLLRMELETVDFRKPGGPLHFGFALLRASGGELAEILDAQWADWDHAGRLVYSQGGKLFAARLKGQSLDAIELADFAGDKPIQIVAPERATRW